MLDQAQNPAIVVVTDNKKQVKKAIEQLPLPDKMKAAALNYYLQERKILDQKMEEEMKKLQQKYDQLALPLYEKQSRIIDGTRLPDEEELKDIDAYLKDEEIELKNQALNDEPIKGYWFKALRNSEIISQEIKEKDEQVLKHLTKIEYKCNESHSFTLRFTFQVNEFFSNIILEKTFFLHPNSEIPIKSESKVIEWKEGKNVTKKTVKKKQKNRKTGMIRMIATEVDADSFFNFFNPINLSDKEELDKLNEEQIDKKAERMDIDYDMARLIIDEIIPYSLEYYLGLKQNQEENIEDFNENDSEGDDENQFQGRRTHQKKQTQLKDKTDCKQQ